MSKEMIIVDDRLESLVSEWNPPSIHWVIARSSSDIHDLLQIGSIKKALIHKTFRLKKRTDRSASGTLPPIVLVFDRIERPPSLRTVLNLMPHLDMVISRADIEKDLEEIVCAPPFFSSWSTRWPDYFPEEMRGMYRIYQRLKFTRETLTSHQWSMLEVWLGTGGVEDVARTMGCHPKTIRNNLKKISGTLGVGDIDEFSRHSFREFIKMVSYIDP